MKEFVDYNFYSVPNTNIVSGGSRTRIKNIIDVLQNNFKAFIIHGNTVQKLRFSLRAPHCKILYIESATNRLKFIDIVSLLIIRKRSEKRYVFIRDVYIELFPDEYTSGRKKITALFNRWSYLFYAYYADELCFPTVEMADAFYRFHPRFPRRPTFSFPPGTFEVKQILKNKFQENFLNDKISFLYLGGTKYSHSGFEKYLNLAENMGNDFIFYIISNDDLTKRIQSFQNVIYLHNLNHKEVINFIIDKNITFAIHTRPENKYDDITFPIKFLDFISCNLPVITFRHKPLKTILPQDYPFYVNNMSSDVILNLVKKIKSDPEVYTKVIQELNGVAKRLTYVNKFKEILEKNK